MSLRIFLLLGLTVVSSNILANDPPKLEPIKQKSQGDGLVTFDSPENDVESNSRGIFPQTVDTQQQLGEIIKSIESNDFNQARGLVNTALKSNPSDKRLKEVEKLLSGNIRPRNMEKFKAEARALMSGRQEASPAPVLASPVVMPSWFNRPSAPVRPDARRPMSKDASLLRDASRKMSIGDTSGAASDATLAIAANANNAQAYWLRAMILLSQKNLKLAHDDASKALQLSPNDSRPLDILSLILTAMGRYRDAIAQANLALELNPKDANAFAARSAAWDNLDKHEESLADLKQAAELDPKQFGDLYRQAFAGNDKIKRRQAAAALFARPIAIYAAAAGLAFFFFAIAIFLKRSRAETAKKASRGNGLHGFRIVKTAGQGGMGVVYEAVDEVLQRKVALKKMREEIAGEPRERKRFLREARTVASLKHPNIIEIYSVIEQGAELYLVFEHLPGQTLDQELSRRKTLTPAETLAVMRQISPALDYAHDRGIIHQDLKPSNIMICHNIAKIMDFGIARRVLETLSTLSRAEVIGTPAYMAPEQELGQLKKESDLFSLGVCLYEMLSGGNPFAPGANYLQKMRHEFPPLSQAKPGLPKEIDRVMATALSPMPLQRYSSARALLRDLQKILQ